MEAMHFATVTELNGKLNSLSRTDEWERIIQLTPLNEDERQIILRAIEHLEKYTPAYDSGHPDAQKLHPVHLDKRRKEVKVLEILGKFPCLVIFEINTVCNNMVFSA